MGKVVSLNDYYLDRPEVKERIRRRLHAQIEPEATVRRALAYAETLPDLQLVRNNDKPAD